MCFPRFSLSKVTSLFTRDDSSSDLEENQFSDFISDADDDFAPGSDAHSSQTFIAPGLK